MRSASLSDLVHLLVPGLAHPLEGRQLAVLSPALLCLVTVRVLEAFVALLGKDGEVGVDCDGSPARAVSVITMEMKILEAGLSNSMMDQI